MNTNMISSLLYFLISGMFAYNFNVISQKIRKGSTKVNKYSLFATSSLVAIFFCEGLQHLGFGVQLVLLAQIYLLGTMAYIIYSKKNEEEKV